MSQDVVSQIGRLLGMRGTARIYRLPMRPAYAVTVPFHDPRLFETLRDADAYAQTAQTAEVSR